MHSAALDFAPPPRLSQSVHTSQVSSAFSSPYETPYIFPQLPRYVNSIRKSSIRPELFPLHSAPEGLDKTLARRSSSAIELFNVYNKSVTDPYFPAAAGPGPARGLASSADPVASTSATADVLQSVLIGPGMEIPQTFPPFYSTSKLLPFQESPQSLPAFLPFGMSSAEATTACPIPSSSQSGPSFKHEEQPSQQFNVRAEALALHNMPCTECAAFQSAQLADT